MLFLFEQPRQVARFAVAVDEHIQRGERLGVEDEGRAVGEDFLDRFELKKALIVIEGENANLELSARNLPFVKVLRAEGVNVYDILKYPNLVLTEAAVDQIEGVLAK